MNHLKRNLLSSFDFANPVLPTKSWQYSTIENRLDADWFTMTAIHVFFFWHFHFFKGQWTIVSLEFNAYPDVTFRHTFIFEFVTLLTNFYIISSTTKHIRKVLLFFHFSVLMYCTSGLLKWYVLLRLYPGIINRYLNGKQGERLSEVS